MKKKIIRHESAAAHDGKDGVLELRRNKVRFKAGYSLNALCAQQAFALTRNTVRTGSYVLSEKRETDAKEIAEACKSVALRMAARAARLAKANPEWTEEQAIAAATLGEGEL